MVLRSDAGKLCTREQGVAVAGALHAASRTVRARVGPLSSAGGADEDAVADWTDVEQSWSQRSFQLLRKTQRRSTVGVDG